MFTIKTLNKISKAGIDCLGAEYQCSDDIKDPDAIMLRSASMHEYSLNDNLLAIARAGAGVNNIPLEKCIENGIVVFNTPGANANSVKELVIAGLLLSSRRISDGISFVKGLSNADNSVAKLVEKGKSNFAGPEIQGKKLGVIGLGAIGILVANCAENLGMEVYGFDPFISIDNAWGLSSSVIHSNSIDEIFANCDYITIHVPLNEHTKNLIDSNAISKMKPDVRILNFARGELVNNKDIVSAVRSRNVACYVTDFPSEELINVDNILTIPHLGASTPESENNCAKMAACELMDYLESGNITNAVSLPNVSIPIGNDGTRICVINRNIPNMLNMITGMLAKHEVNINNLQNKSKGDYAYTLIDAAGDLPPEAYQELCETDGIIKVRVIIEKP